MEKTQKPFLQSAENVQHWGSSDQLFTISCQRWSMGDRYLDIEDRPKSIDIRQAPVGNRRLIVREQKSTCDLPFTAVLTATRRASSTQRALRRIRNCRIQCFVEHDGGQHCIQNTALRVFRFEGAPEFRESSSPVYENPPQLRRTLRVFEFVRALGAMQSRLQISDVRFVAWERQTAEEIREVQR